MYSILIDADEGFLEITIDGHTYAIYYGDIMAACYHAAMIEDVILRWVMGLNF